MLKHLTLTTPAIQHLCACDKHLAKAIAMVGPLDYQVVPDGYAFLVSQIIGQMLANHVAALSDAAIRQVGLSRSKVAYIRHLTTAVTTGTVDFARYPTLSDQAVIANLTQIKGIGQWSAKMYLIFALDRPNVLPYEDGAFLQGYGWVYKTRDYRASAVQKKCHKWQPYASYAARYLYKARDLGLTKHPFHLFK